MIKNGIKYSFLLISESKFMTTLQKPQMASEIMLNNLAILTLVMNNSRDKEITFRIPQKIKINFIIKASIP